MPTSQCCFEQIDTGVKCIVCKRTVKTEYPPEKVHAVCGGGRAYSIDGVGNDLHAVLKALGFDIRFNCGCENWIYTMNRQGIAWCKLNKATIVKKLQGEAKKRKYTKLLTNSFLIGLLLDLTFTYSSSKSKFPIESVTSRIRPLLGSAAGRSQDSS